MEGKNSFMTGCSNIWALVEMMSTTEKKN